MASRESALSKHKVSKPKSKSKKSKKRIAHTHIEHGLDGSHVIRHSFDQGPGGDEGEPPTPDSIHGVSDSNGLLAHLQDQLGGQTPGEMPGGPGGAGAGAPPQGM
jgi:hypothetical protein